MGSDGESTDIMEPVRNWVNTYGIKANAVDSLLKLLKQNGHPNLPSSSRTLLKTPGEVDIIKVSSVDYFYFGLETMINNEMKKYNQTDIQAIDNSITLSLNMQFKAPPPTFPYSIDCGYIQAIEPRVLK